MEKDIFNLKEKLKNTKKEDTAQESIKKETQNNNEKKKAQTKKDLSQSTVEASKEKPKYHIKQFLYSPVNLFFYLYNDKENQDGCFNKYEEIFQSTTDTDIAKYRRAFNFILNEFVQPKIIANKVKLLAGLDDKINSLTILKNEKKDVLQIETKFNKLISLIGQDEVFTLAKTTPLEIEFKGKIFQVGFPELLLKLTDDEIKII